MFETGLNLVGDNLYAFLLVDYDSLNIVDANPLARDYYFSGTEIPKLENIFFPTLTKDDLGDIVSDLSERGHVSLDRIFSLKTTEEAFPCHIEICKIDGDKLFLLVKEKNLIKDWQMKEIVFLWDNPIFVLNSSDNFTVTYGNSRFYESISGNKDAFVQQKEANFLNLFSDSTKTSFQQLLHQELDAFSQCNIDIELTFDQEYYQLFRYHGFKSSFDHQIYGVLMRIKTQSELMKKIEYDQQYFDIMQKFSKDLLFRVDVKQKRLIHRGDISKISQLPPELTDFPESFRHRNTIHPEDLEAYLTFSYRLLSGIPSSCEPRILFQNGTYEKYRLQGSPLFDGEGNVTEILGKCENIQKFIDIEARAYVDSLTHCLKKEFFQEFVEKQLKSAKENETFALLFLDLDNFKGTNDKMGHIFGDFLLESVSKRIQNAIRSQDKLGRVGGDEFAIFFQHAQSPQAVQERADTILHSLRREYNHEGTLYKTKASIGVSLFPKHGTTYESLYKIADKALFQAKELGKDTAIIYAES